MQLDADYIVVGSGFAGSIWARELAERGERVALLERRPHIAGNMYDGKNGDGITIHYYGPHIFHTNRQAVFDYLSRFAKFEQFRLTYRAVIRGIPVPCPFNFNSIRLLYPLAEAEALISALLESFPGTDEVTVFSLLGSERKIIRDYGELLFEEDFRPYTAKQWGIPPEEIDRSVLNRVKVLLNERNTYFNDLYEGIPIGGYSAMFEQILAHPNIQVLTKTNALDEIRFDKKHVNVSGQVRKAVIFTGAIDELFKYRFGRLPYRSLRFEHKSMEINSYQDAAIYAYPKNTDFTRITEYTKLPKQTACDGTGELGKTAISIEYPLPFDPDSTLGNEPYYPIINEPNQALYNRYRDYAEQYKNLILCGRLAEYRYYNMDDVVAGALERIGRF